MQARKDSVQFILQDDNPVYYASRTLTSAEKNYQNLERECIVAVWGMEKFHYFLYGKHFTLQTDQKPLVSIFRKHMIDVSPRIQRIPICAWQYQFKPQYISGKMNVIADALLRVTPLDFEDHNVDKEVLAVNVLTYTAIEEKEKTELLNETDKDAELQALKMVISKGWPKKRSSLAPNLQPYWNYRDELTIEDGILMKGQKIIIPTSLKQQYIDKIHTGHTGIGSCLKKAREFVFWVNYSKDIQEADYRCTPISSSIPSPAEILFGYYFRKFPQRAFSAGAISQSSRSMQAILCMRTLTNFWVIYSKITIWELIPIPELFFMTSHSEHFLICTLNSQKICSYFKIYRYLSRTHST